MESHETLDSDFSSGLSLNGEIKGFLQETAKWANFIAIIGFIGVGFMILFALFFMFFMGSFAGAMGGPAAFSPAIFGVFYLIMAVIYIFPILYLYRFASNMKTALREENEEALTISFSNLKSHYKFFGILLAIMLGLYALMFLIGIIGGGLAAFF